MKQGNAFFYTFVLVLLFFAVSRSAPAQCPNPQGNAHLSLSGLPQIGSGLTMALSGRPYGTPVLAVDTTPGPTVFPWGTLCLGPTMQILIDGYNRHPFIRIPPSGTYHFPITIPPIQSLIGQTFYFQAVIEDDQAPNKMLAISNSVTMKIAAKSSVTSIYSEDFEIGWNGWSVVGGTWHIGAPGSGDPGPLNGKNVAATILGGNYPRSVTSKLISPSIVLPVVNAGEEIRLAFFEYHRYNDHDSGWVEVSPNDGKNWIRPPCSPTKWGDSWVWSRTSIDLTQFAGMKIRIAFIHQSGGYYESRGWYIDAVSVFSGKLQFQNPETWDNWFGLWWHTDNGLWHTGVPTAGPGIAHTTPNCAGVMLGGNYPRHTDSRLISPTVTLPTTRPVTLEFYSWHRLSDEDYGNVQVSTDGGCSWAYVGPTYSGTGVPWTRNVIDLSAYAGMSIKICFLHRAGGYYEEAGWYIDDVMIR